MPREIFRNADLAVRFACDFGADVCVITFDSYSDGRSLDRSGFGQDFLASHQVDAIHFISRENDWYQYAEMPAITATVAALVKDYRRVVAYGSSMGAYAAIRFGGLAGATAALALSPQFSIDPRVAPFERRWKYDSRRVDFTLERTLNAPFVETAYIAYDPCDRDRRHADLFRSRTRVIDIHLPGVGHPAIGALSEADLLSPLVLDFLADTVDVPEVARNMRAIRETTPQFYQVRSDRSRLPSARMAYASKAAAMAPNRFGFAIHYASLLAISGRFAEAQIAFARAAALSPDHPVLLLRLAEFHQWRGDLESAVETAESLVALHSDTYRPKLESLRALLARRSRRYSWPALSIRGGRIVGNRALPIDVRVTTTPSPPPFVDSWRRHEGLLARRPSGPIDVMVVGDSLVEYWLDSYWAPLRVFNFGVKADKTQHVLWRLEQLPAASIECRNVVILLGANNLGAGDTPTGIAMGVAAVVAAAVRVAPKARILVIATPPCGPDSRFRQDARRKSNAALASLDGFETLEVDAEMLGVGDGGRSPNYTDDGTHLSSAGYQLLTGLVRGHLV